MNRIPLSCALNIKGRSVPCVVNVRLNDGRVIRDLLCLDGKCIAGTVVGGHEGVVETDFDFSTDDVADVKLQTWTDTFATTRAIKEKLRML